MWRHFDELAAPLGATNSPANRSRLMGRGVRSGQRRWLQVADGLCRVARYAAARARRLRHELLLIPTPRVAPHVDDPVHHKTVAIGTAARGRPGVWSPN
jgi:hypothetical protein